MTGQILVLSGIGYKSSILREIKDDMKARASRADALHAALVEDQKLQAEASKRADERYLEESKRYLEESKRYLEESKKADEKYFRLFEEVKNIKREKKTLWWWWWR
jgi:hypothetical protein